MGAIILLLVLALMWVLLAVPRQREARRHNAVLAALVVGDEVMTTSGLFGTVVDRGDDHVRLEVSPGVVVKVATAAISFRVEAASLAAEADPSVDDVVEAGTTDRSED